MRANTFLGEATRSEGRPQADVELSEEVGAPPPVYGSQRVPRHVASIRGSMCDESLDALLRNLARGRRSGTLVARRAGEVVYTGIYEGQLVSCGPSADSSPASPEAMREQLLGLYLWGEGAWTYEHDLSAPAPTAPAHRLR